MMKERRNIRESRLREAARKAENRKLLIDTLTIGLIGVFAIGIVVVIFGMAASI